MPGSDASDLPQTLVGLTRKFLGVPTRGDTFLSLSFVDTDNVDDFILSKDGINVDRLLQKTSGVVDLVADGSTVHLDFHDVGLLRSQRKKLHLGMSDDTDDLAVLLHLVEVFLDLLLTIFVLPLAAGLAESLLLGFVPVLVESALALFTDMLSKDGFEGTESTRGFNVPDASNNNHGWCLQDCHSINHFLLIGF